MLITKNKVFKKKSDKKNIETKLQIWAEMQKTKGKRKKKIEWIALCTMSNDSRVKLIYEDSEKKDSEKYSPNLEGLSMLFSRISNLKVDVSKEKKENLEKKNKLYLDLHYFRDSYHIKALFGDFLENMEKDSKGYILFDYIFTIENLGKYQLYLKPVNWHLLDKDAKSFEKLCKDNGIGVDVLDANNKLVFHELQRKKRLFGRNWGNTKAKMKREKLWHALKDTLIECPEEDLQDFLAFCKQKGWVDLEKTSKKKKSVVAKPNPAPQPDAVTEEKPTATEVATEATATEVATEGKVEATEVEATQTPEAAPTEAGVEQEAPPIKDETSTEKQVAVQDETSTEKQVAVATEPAPVAVEPAPVAVEPAPVEEPTIKKLAEPQVEEAGPVEAGPVGPVETEEAGPVEAGPVETEEAEEKREQVEVEQVKGLEEGVTERGEKVREDVKEEEKVEAGSKEESSIEIIAYEKRGLDENLEETYETITKILKKGEYVENIEEIAEHVESYYSPNEESNYLIVRLKEEVNKMYKCFEIKDMEKLKKRKMPIMLMWKEIEREFAKCLLIKKKVRGKILRPVIVARAGQEMETQENYWEDFKKSLWKFPIVDKSEVITVVRVLSENVVMLNPEKGKSREEALPRLEEKNSTYVSDDFNQIYYTLREKKNELKEGLEIKNLKEYCTVEKKERDYYIRIRRDLEGVDYYLWYQGEKKQESEWILKFAFLIGEKKNKYAHLGWWYIKKGIFERKMKDENVYK